MAGKHVKPERRRKTPVDFSDSGGAPTPRQQSSQGGAGGGREAARRTGPRTPKAAGAKAKPRPHGAVMSDKGIDKKAKSAARTERARNKPSAAPAEAAPTPNRALRGARPQKRTLRDQGVDARQ